MVYFTFSKDVQLVRYKLTVQCTTFLTGITSY